MPRTATIYFDGHCLLCSTSVRFILRNDRNRKFRFAVLTEAQHLLKEENSSVKKTGGSVLLVEDGITYRESTAVLRILTGLGFPWSVVGVLRVIPAVLRDPFYRLISANRYRWFGRSDSCFLPDPSFADRFK